jgi:hypothetical protein
MDRRDLLKGLLGIAIGSGIKWEAKEAPTPKMVTGDTFLAHRLRALHLPKARLETFSGIVFTDTGQQLYAPSVKNVIIKTTKFHHVQFVEWEFDEIKISKQFCLTRIKVIDDLNTCVIDHTFNPLINCRAGDVLRLYQVHLTF